MPMSKAQQTPRPISQQVVDAVAEAEDIDPVDVTPRLYHAIDADALDSMFELQSKNTNPGLDVSFDYCGYEVSIESDGSISLHDESS